METVVFSQEAQLLGRYTSQKAAKEAHKGEKGLHFINANNFQPIGEYDTVDQLFPKPEPTESGDGSTTSSGATGPRNRYTHPPMAGPYVVRTVACRANMDDPRYEYVEALLANTSFEGYFAAVVNKKVEYVSNKGKPSAVSAERMMRYFLKRGWVDYPEGSPEAEAMAAVRAAYTEVRKANAKTKKADQPAAEKTAAEQAEDIGGYTEATDEEQTEPAEQS